MITTLAELLKQALSGGLRGTLAVAAAHDAEVIEAVVRARALGLAEAILVGEAPLITRAIEGAGASATDFRTVPAAGPEEAAAEAVRLVADGEADVLMKGHLDTAVLLRAVLDPSRGLREARLLSHVAVFEVDRYPKLLTITDAALNIAPDVDAKEQIIRNALRVTRALGIETAKVAVLAAKETVNPRMQATVDAAELARRDIDGAVVAGPLALDNALSAQSARLKGIDSPVAGDADVLVVPQIESGNILYKALTLLGHAQGAGIVVGARCPIVLTSRADDEQTKLNSIALASLVAARRGVPA